ncbi:MAG TPA: hypothetical protein ENH80_14415 [Phycisphaerae bacterium]|nr:hypothetical protein [Phycisphaerae bacterium]HDZ45123.1 hypothetical protein [Phycisphaerae bacterium]
MPWRRKPPEAVLRHYAPWCNEWVQKGSSWILQWDMASLRHYYLYHLLLHEVGHFNHPFHNSWKRREDSAEDFALTWARRLGALE